MTAPVPDASRDPAEDRAGTDAGPGAGFGPRSALTTAAWFGVLTGLIELAVLLVWHSFNNAAMLGSLQMNRHFLWMIPLSYLVVFVAMGVPVALASCSWPGPSRRWGVFLFSGLAVFSLLKMVPGLYTAAALVLAMGVAQVAGARVSARPARRPRWVDASLALSLALVLALGVVSYCREVLAERLALAGLPTARAGAPNVLLIVLDTVRADRLSLYGYRRDTTPNLARLARRGVVFNEARSAAPWTLPSHASLFTGRWPHELRVGGDRPLDGTYPTIAERLAKHGYATAGFVGNTYFCNSWYGLGRGFAHYEDYYEQNVIVSPGEAFGCTALGRWVIRVVGTAYNARPESSNTPKDAARVNRDFLRWQTAHRDRPFFAFLNYIDAHDPYLTPPGFDRHFGVKPETPEDVETIRYWHHRQKSAVDERELTLVNDAYDDCLASLDENLGRLFDELERTGVLKDTLVIVTSDHGEHLGEHGLQGHGKSLYRAEVHVPLIIVGPSGIPGGRTIDRPVSLLDVAPTILDRVGLAGDSPFPGRSLAPLWGVDGGPDHDRPVLSEVRVKEKILTKPSDKLPPAYLGPMSSLLTEGKVYIRDAFGREELYDVASDPHEARNLARSPEALESLNRCRLTLDRLAGDDTLRR